MGNPARADAHEQSTVSKAWACRAIMLGESDGLSWGKWMDSDVGEVDGIRGRRGTNSKGVGRKTQMGEAGCT